MISSFSRISESARTDEKGLSYAGRKERRESQGADGVLDIEMVDTKLNVENSSTAMAAEKSQYPTKVMDEELGWDSAMDSNYQIIKTIEVKTQPF